MEKISYYYSICILSVFGFADATYLSYKACIIRFFEAGGQSACDITKSFSCSEVLRSPYSQIFGISFPWIAFCVYPILFLLAYLGYKSNYKFYAKWLQTLSFLGMLFNFFIIYREIFYIYSYCILCLICTFIIIAIFILSSLLLKGKRSTLWKGH